MAINTLNKEAYAIGADNLLAPAQFPMVHRTLDVTNPKVALVRGMAVINASGSLYVAGAKGGDEGSETTLEGDIIGIIAADHDADTTSETVSVDAFVSGAFNAARVVTINDLDVTSAAYVYGAQGNGIYLL